MVARGRTHWSDMGGELEQMVHDFAKNWQAALKAVADALARDFDWSTSLLHYVSQVRTLGANVPSHLALSAGLILCPCSGSPRSTV